MCAIAARCNNSSTASGSCKLTGAEAYNKVRRGLEKTLLWEQADTMLRSIGQTTASAAYARRGRERCKGKGGSGCLFPIKAVGNPNSLYLLHTGSDVVTHDHHAVENAIAVARNIAVNLDDAPPTPPAPPEAPDSSAAVTRDAVQSTDATVNTSGDATSEPCPRIPSSSFDNDDHFDNVDANLATHYHDPISTPLPGCGPSPSVAPLVVHTHYYDPPRQAAHPGNGPSPSVAPHPNIDYHNDGIIHNDHDINNNNPSPMHHYDPASGQEVTDSLVESEFDEAAFAAWAARDMTEYLP